MFINELHEGTEYTLSQLAHDTKLGRNDLLEGRKAMQTDLDSQNLWVKVNCMSFSKAKYQVLHLGHNNPKQNYWLQEEWLENSAEENNLGLLVEHS